MKRGLLSVHALSVGAMTTAAAGLVLAGGTALAVVYGPPDLARSKLIAGLAVLGMITGFGALWLLRDALNDHLRDLARLRALTVALRAGDEPPGDFPEAGDSETGQLRESLLSLAGEVASRRTAPDRRLAAVLGALSEAVVVITANGQVSLVNGAARALLGSARVEVGTSVFAALLREPVEKALSAARETGGNAAVRLETVDGQIFDARVSLLLTGEGAVIAASPDHDNVTGEVALDLTLHDIPPVPVAAGPTTLLSELPVTVLDLETTGLNPAQDRIVAIGAVRMHGGTIFRAATVDCLVNPGVPIPRASTVVHGIHDTTVAAMPPIAEHLPQLLELIGHSIVVGYNIGFDLAVLTAEAARASLPWTAPAALDALQLAAALDPREPAFDLEDVAARHGVPVLGRHTALGDALVTAELWRRLAIRLEERGVRTLAEARAFAATANRVIAHQRAAGW